MNVQLSFSSCVTSNETEPISFTSSTAPKKKKQKKNSCYVEVEIDSKFVALLTDIEKLEKVLQLNVVPNKEKISKIKAMKTGLNILTKRSAHLN